MQSANRIPVEYIIVNTDLTQFGIPSYQTLGSAGMDLRAMFDIENGERSLTIQPDETVLIPSGLQVYIKDPGYLGFILPRSGLGHKRGLVLGNLIGCLDSDFQGDLQISLWNRGTEPQTIQYGDRIAQLVFMPVVQAELIRVFSFEESERGEGGWGHTGV